MVSDTIDLAAWRRTGALLVNGFLTGEHLSRVQGWVDEIERRPGGDSGLLQYDEVVGHGPPVRCRTENIVPFHAGLRQLLTAGPVVDIATALLGEPAVLYKEKINYKQPGGAGFAPHQDAPAYPFVRRAITCMIAIDDSDVHNGCLEIAEGMHHGLPTDESGCLPAELASNFRWTPIPARAGSLLWFDWYLPHRSGPNRSRRRRRAIYLTYNALADGDHRHRYYAEKRRRLATDTGRLSLIGHFAGDSFPTPEPSS